MATSPSLTEQRVVQGDVILRVSRILNAMEDVLLRLPGATFEIVASHRPRNPTSQHQNQNSVPPRPLGQGRIPPGRLCRLHHPALQRPAQVARRRPKREPNRSIGKFNPCGYRRGLSAFRRTHLSPGESHQPNLI